MVENQRGVNCLKVVSVLFLFTVAKEPYGSKESCIFRNYIFHVFRPIPLAVLHLRTSLSTLLCVKLRMNLRIVNLFEVMFGETKTFTLYKILRS